MGLYRRFVVPYLVDLSCRSADLGAWRDRVCAGLSGTVVEVGFGTGLNLAHIPRTVHSLYAIEPSRTAKRIAARRIRECPANVELIGIDGRAIPLADRSCDGALVSFAMCTVPDPRGALDEIFRVLKPGGRLHLLEHGIAPDPLVARWQRWLDPLEGRIADGCSLTRDPRRLVEDSSFDLISIVQSYAHGPRPWSYFTLAVVERPPGQIPS